MLVEFFWVQSVFQTLVPTRMSLISDSVSLKDNTALATPIRYNSTHRNQGQQLVSFDKFKKRKSRQCVLHAPRKELCSSLGISFCAASLLWFSFSELYAICLAVLAVLPTSPGFYSTCFSCILLP